MGQYYMTIDGGTTNTRLYLWDENAQLIDREHKRVGVRDTAIDGGNHRLKTAVKDGLSELLERNSITFSDISSIIASGMITSEVGLVEIPHLPVPAGLKEIAKSVVTKELKDVCPIPITFVPGIKNMNTPFVDEQSCEAMDIMRGEETESLALIDKCFNNKPMILILPGSHSKFVAVDTQKRITGCLTTISGELLDVITNHTIISKAVDKGFVKRENYSKDHVLKGYDTAAKVGLSRACFSGRILSLFSTLNAQEIANYLLGAVLQSDVAALLHSSCMAPLQKEDIDLVICGKDVLQQALFDVISHEVHFRNTRMFNNDSDTPLSAIGAFLIAKSRDELRQ